MDGLTFLNAPARQRRRPQHTRHCHHRPGRSHTVSRAQNLRVKELPDQKTSSKSKKLLE